jgi:hypothetical protein
VRVLISFSNTAYSNSIGNYNIHYKATLFPACGRGRGGFLVGKAVIVPDAGAELQFAHRRWELS